MTAVAETKKETRSELEIIADRIDQAEKEADRLVETISESQSLEALSHLGTALQAVEIRIIRLKQEFKEADTQD